MKRLFFVFLLLTQSYHDSCANKIKSNSDLPTLLQFIEIINIVCSKDKCDPVCCQLRKYYSVAKESCTDVDGQLAKLNLRRPAPFSIHKDSWDCGNISSNCRISDHYQLIASNNSKFQHFCNNFIEACYNYTIKHLHKFGKNVLPNVYSEILCPIFLVAFSILILTLIFFLYLAVPQLRNRVQDKCFLFHLSSRIVVMCAFLIQLFPQLEDKFCLFRAFVHQFSGLATSFWLNVLCFHLWRSIRSIIPPNRPSIEIIGWYSLYAWGCPLLITGTTHLADHYLPIDSFLKSDIKLACFIRDYEVSQGSRLFQPVFIYYYSITTLLQIINLCFFFHMVYIISPLSRVSKGHDEDLRRHQTKELGILTYLKLFLYMGFIRILNIILYYFGTSNILKNTECLLYAICIFLIFVCNGRVFKLAKKRFLKRASSHQLTM